MRLGPLGCGLPSFEIHMTAGFGLPPFFLFFSHHRQIMILISHIFYFHHRALYFHLPT
jgi:hypothetical protein